MYRDEEYNTDFLTADIVLVSIRSALTLISTILYCPDYFEYLIGKFDVSFYLRTTNSEYTLIRSTVDLVLQYVIGVIVCV